MRTGRDFEHDVDVAIGACFATRARTEQRDMRDAGRASESIYYSAASGIARSSLRETSRRLSKASARKALFGQFRWPVGMSLCRPLGEGLWEVRSSLSNKRIARMFFCFTEGRLVALHGFIKKTRKTSDDELLLARKRLREFT